MPPPVAGRGAVVAGRAVPRAPEGVGRTLVYKVKEFTS
ncbi:hypothetical protein SUDANB108_01166 [Streptomyces sp. enrichment culture]